MAELRPGTFSRLFTEVGAESQRRLKVALDEVARTVERAAKEELVKGGTHTRGTKTPASPGGPPALVSGTLRRSVTHTTPVPTGFGWECRVGVGAGFTPPYGRTTSSKYGLILEETGLRNGATYPWLKPSFLRVMPQVHAVSAEWFRSGHWPHI